MSNKKEPLAGFGLDSLQFAPAPDGARGPKQGSLLPESDTVSAIRLQDEEQRDRIARQKSADVRGQLRRGRTRRFIRLQRDPAREIALAVMLLAALACLTVFGASWKQHRFELLGQGSDSTFWMESAQRFRYVRMVAAGEEIPAVDAEMQAPDGYQTKSDTILQERFYGRVIREIRERASARGDTPPQVAAAVRAISRWVSASSVFPMALLVLGITRRRDAALVAAGAFILALPVAERGTGAVLFREDVAVPMLLWHLAFLGMWTRRPRHVPGSQPIPRNVVPALASGVALATALLLWKVVAFYLLLLVVFVGSSFALRRDRPGRLALGWGLVLAPCVAACFLPLSLQHDGFLTATPMLASYALLLGLIGAAVTKKSPAVWLGVAVAVLVGARLALPTEAGLDHAWETILAKIRFLDQKPDDPTLLSFHARHYWTGNYFSPTVRRLARDWPFLAAAALPGLVFAFRWWLSKGGPTADQELDKPPPTGLLEGDGPSVPLPPSTSHFVVWLVVALGGSYLMFTKLQLFAAIAAAALVGLGFAAITRPRRLARTALVGLLLLSAAHGWGAVPGADVLLPQAEGQSAVEVFPPESMNRMAEMVRTHTGEDEPILASFVVSPFILTYLDRPTILHCFFEGDLLGRFEDVVMARFGTEEALADVARSYGAKYYLHEAHHTLRTDPRMSQRYTAARLDWPMEAAVTEMSFAPERLKHFELVAEDGYFRLFKVRDAPGRGVRSRGSVSTLWNRALFTALFGDPLKSNSPRGDGLRPAHLLYIEQTAEGFLKKGRVGPFADREWANQRASEVAPYLVEPHETLAALYAERGRTDRAQKHRQRAAVLRAALRGTGRLPDDAVPAPIVLRD